MSGRPLRDRSAKGGEQAKYGVFLNVHHLKDEKHVILHKLPCYDYTEHTTKPAPAGTYVKHKGHSKFDAAVKHASDLSLNWHANIRTCKECWKK